MPKRKYIAIDLKSFYASVECTELGLDPLTTNLVVADKSRTEKTICLAVSPSLKAYGIPGRARLFEVVQKVKEVNGARRQKLHGENFTGESYNAEELAANPELRLSYIVAQPRMSCYIKYSAQIYDIYLQYIAPEDIHVYSIDEVFMDVTDYLVTYKTTAHELAMTIIRDVLKQTGITATAGVGTNLYLCKVAMDIVAKHVEPDKDGMRIAELDEMSYRRQLWTHTPLTDFWRVGRGYAKKLEEIGLYTMGDIARCSLGGPQDYYNEAILYKLFGVNAELLIDHAWGWEPCGIPEIKAYRPETRSICSGQVLQKPYRTDKAKLIVREMADLLALDLVKKRLTTNQIVLTLGYDVENLADAAVSAAYCGEITLDRYGRKIPKHAHGTENFPLRINSAKLVTAAATKLFDRIANPQLWVRRVTLVANNLLEENGKTNALQFQQQDLFVDCAAEEARKKMEKQALERERKVQETVLTIKEKYGKNAVLKGMNLEKDATTISRNAQIGGHKA